MVVCALGDGLGDGCGGMVCASVKPTSKAALGMMTNVRLMMRELLKCLRFIETPFVVKNDCFGNG